jgi:DHA3 family tetracycline resistance protein-like MFS transporter
LFADRLRMSASRVYLLMGAWRGFAWALTSVAYVLYYITVAHLDPLQLVLVGTALETSYFLCEIPTGVLADTFSRRLSVIAGTAIIGIAWMGQGLVPLFIAIVGFEILRGLGEAFTHGAIEAWVAGEVGDDGLDTLFLRETQLTQIAGFVGLPIGVLLATFDLRIPIILGGALGLTLAILLVLVMPERRHPRRDSATTWRATIGTARRGLLAVRTSAPARCASVRGVLLGCRKRGLRPSDGRASAHRSAVPAVRHHAGHCVRRALACERDRDHHQCTVDPSRGAAPRGARHVSFARRAAARACRGPALFALAPSWGLALVPYFFESIVRASFYPLFNAWLIRRTDEEVRATVLSTTSVSNALGQMGGGPISGAIGNVYGIPAALLSSAALLLPGALFFARATGLRAGAICRHEPEAALTKR